ncbi:hypothetical protein [Myxosarcina sp. GI1(2024)]
MANDNIEDFEHLFFHDLDESESEAISGGFGFGPGPGDQTLLKNAPSLLTNYLNGILLLPIFAPILQLPPLTIELPPLPKSSEINSGKRKKNWLK